MPKSRKTGNRKGVYIVILVCFLICEVLCGCQDNGNGNQDNPTIDNNTHVSEECSNPDDPTEDPTIQLDQGETKTPEEDVFSTEPEAGTNPPTEGAPPTQPEQEPEEETNPSTQPTQEPTEGTELPTQEPTSSSDENDQEQEETQEPTEYNGPINLPTLPA